MQIKGCAAIVTGGASGLGAAVVDALADAGAQVGVFDLNPGAVSQRAHVLAFRVDVSRPDDIERALADAEAEHGTARIVVNCAGIGEFAPIVGPDGPMDRGHLLRTIAVNLTGTLDVIRLAASRMAAGPASDGDRGVIVNTASVAAWDGLAMEVAYSAAKAGVAGMTLPLARDLSPLGIRVNCIAPGVFRTPLANDLTAEVEEQLLRETPFPRRMGDPREFAALALHLIENEMLNGETIRIDGGLRMGFRHPA